MVFSAANQSSESAEVSPYGIVNVNIGCTPLVQATKVPDEIMLSVQVSILNCTRTVLALLLSELSDEILGKADKLLSGFTQQPPQTNNPVSTFGYGQVIINVRSTPLFQNTFNPDEIVFAVTVTIINCNRTRLVDVLNGLDAQIMDKVEDVL